MVRGCSPLPMEESGILILSSKFQTRLPQSTVHSNFTNPIRAKHTRNYHKFVVVLSSLASSCVLFDIDLHLLMELQWLMLSKHKRLFHSSRVKFPFVSVSASWFLVSMHLIWILGVQIDLIEQTIKSNSVVSGNMSLCRPSSLYNHFDHCFVVFKHIQQSFLVRRIYV